MILLALVKPNSGVDYHRILLPLKHLNLVEGDKIITFSNDKPLVKSFFKGVNLVLYSRECPFRLDQLLEFRKEFGFKIIVDVDDYWRLYPGHILSDYWYEKKTTEQIVESLNIADFITTTHQYLRSKIHSIVPNKQIEILSNALPYDIDQFTDHKEQTNNILYSCGITHYEDIKTLRRFFELCKQNQDIQKYRFCVAGYNSSNELSKTTWFKIENEGRRFGNYLRMVSLPLESYMNHYSMAKIAIAPLVNNEFNRSKSFLKVLEAGCKNIPIIASDMHPYVEMPGVILCKTQRDWYEALKMLVKNPEKISEYGNTLGKYVREHFHLTKVNLKRKQLYDQWGTNHSTS